MSLIKKRPTGNTHKTNGISKAAMLLSVLAITICMVTTFVLDHKPKLAYVDVNKLIQHYDRTKVDREALEKKTSVMKANVDSCKDEVGLCSSGYFSIGAQSDGNGGVKNRCCKLELQ